VKHIGEIIETNTKMFECQSVKLDESPDFGGFVKVISNDMTIYGIVFNICTMSEDITRKPVAFGLTEEELRRQQPQIFELMHTYFKVLIIGYKKEGYRGILPPRPAKIHSFVYDCEREDLIDISKDLNFLKNILNGQTGIEEELVASVIRNLSKVVLEKDSYMITVGKELIRLLKNDFDRFLTIKRMCKI
jgi:hypothetical protein